MDDVTPAGYSDMSSDMVMCWPRFSIYYRLSTGKNCFMAPI